MIRQNSEVAALVDAALILKEVFGYSYAEALLEAGTVPAAVIQRVLFGRPSHRRIMRWRDSAGAPQVF